MGKLQLWLDMDDTVFDTEGYIRNKMIEIDGIKWADTGCCVYDLYGCMPDSLYEKCVIDTFDNYWDIPVKYGFLENIDEIRRMYDVSFITRVGVSRGEVESKKKTGSSLGIPVYCVSGGVKKSDIIKSGVQVDDRVCELVKNDSVIPILFSDGTFKNKEFSGLAVKNWREAMKVLRYFYRGYVDEKK